MYYSYILISKKDNSYYYGSTDDIPKRIKEHNAGKVRYTKGHRPYVYHFSEVFNTRSEAFRRERFYKSIDGYKWLKSKDII